MRAIQVACEYVLMQELLEDLTEAIHNTRIANDKYKIAKAEEDQARQALKEYMQSSGLLSAKNHALTVSMVHKPVIEITHEQSVINWLRDSPDIEEDQYIGLKATPFKVMALAKMKTTGEQIDGTEVVTQEILSVRKREK